MGNLRLAKPSPSTRPSVWEEWEKEAVEAIGNPRLGISDARKVTPAYHGRLAWYPCKHIHRRVKATLARLTTGMSVGAKNHVDGQEARQLGADQSAKEGGENHPTDGAQSCLPLAASSEPQTTGRQSILRHATVDAEYDTTMEALGTNWRRSVAITPQPKEYLEEAGRPSRTHRWGKLPIWVHAWRGKHVFL